MVLLSIQKFSAEIMWTTCRFSYFASLQYSYGYTGNILTDAVFTTFSITIITSTVIIAWTNICASGVFMTIIAGRTAYDLYAKYEIIASLNKTVTGLFLKIMKNY